MQARDLTRQHFLGDESKNYTWNPEQVLAHWLIPVITAPRRQVQKGHKFQSSLKNRVRPCLIKTTQPPNSKQQQQNGIQSICKHFALAYALSSLEVTLPTEL